MADPKLYAWIYDVDNQDIPKLLGAFKGKVGGILYQKNYDMSLAPGKWMAYVGDGGAATQLVQTVNKGGKIDAAIVLDERNSVNGGPSGNYWSPQKYADEYNPLYDILHAAGIPVSTMGLVGVPTGKLSYITNNVKFDDDYYNKMMPLLRGAEYNAFNPESNRHAEIDRVLNTYTDRKWIFSPHPVNPLLFPFCQNTLLSYPLENYIFHENIPYWVEKSKDPKLLGVAIWSLRYNMMNCGGKRMFQKFCNIFTDKNKLTVVGRQLKKALGV